MYKAMAVDVRRVVVTSGPDDELRLQ